MQPTIFTTVRGHVALRLTAPIDTVIKLVDSPALVDDLPVASRWFSAHVDCGVTVFVITILPGIQSTGELI